MISFGVVAIQKKVVVIVVVAGMLRAVWAFYSCYGAPFIFLASLLLFFLARELEDEHQATFSVVAARQSWNVRKKAVLCRRAGWCYLLVSLLGFLSRFHGNYMWWWRAMQRLVYSLWQWWKRVCFRCLLGQVCYRGVESVVAMLILWLQQVSKWVRRKWNNIFGAYRGRVRPPPAGSSSRTSSVGQKKGGSGGGSSSQSVAFRMENGSRAGCTNSHSCIKNSPHRSGMEGYRNSQSPVLHTFDRNEVVLGASMQTACPPLPLWREKGGRQWRQWHQSRDANAVDEGTAQYTPHAAKSSRWGYDDSSIV